MRFNAVIVVGMPESKRTINEDVFAGTSMAVYHWRGFNAERLSLVADDGTAVRSAGHLGCYLAHLGALRLVTQMCFDRVLIVEDDAQVQPQFFSLLEPFETEADLIVIRGAKDDIPQLRVPGFCYGVSKAGAERLVEFLEDRRSHIDFALGQAVVEGVVDAWFLADQIVIHNHQTSTTHPAPEGLDYSQYGEQRIIAEWLASNGVTHGQFLEIGAADGITGSNCRALYEAGWGGMTIEPNPYLFTQLHRVYAESDRMRTLCALVWPWDEVRTVHLNQDGRSTSFADIFVQSQRSGIPFHSFAMSATVAPKVLAGYGPWTVVSIDAEGADLEIVRHGAEMLAGTRLLIVESSQPCSLEPAKDRETMLAAAAGHGFTVVVGETPGNLILARPAAS